MGGYGSEEETARGALVLRDGQPDPKGQETPMKYFTPELYIRGNSPDEDVVDGVEEEWERAIRRYRRRWGKIKAALPEGVRRFHDERICLHDARLLRLGREGDRFIMVLETEPPARDLAILTFTLTAPPTVVPDALPEDLRGSEPYWLYEEFDLDERKRCCFEVFFNNGWLIKLQFRDFQFLVARPILPGVNGQAEGSAAEITRTGSP
jgi:hypothetical protein